MERAEQRLARGGGAVEWLRVPAALFGAAARMRRAAYDIGLAPVSRLPVPVVCVGNLTTGGTGKTPMCAFVVRALQERGWSPGLLSRGYRSEGGAPNDEARLLARSCPGVPHVQDPDRVRGGRALLARGVDVVVLDDGFQHRRLHRDVDLVLVDALRPWGLPAIDGRNFPDAMLPRGLLREPKTSLARADAIAITRSDLVHEDVLAGLELEVAALAPGRPIARAVHRPLRLRGPGGDEVPLAALRGQRVELVSGIGNPAGFEASVRALGASVCGGRSFADHHRYRREDLEGLGSAARWVVTTAKDAVKLEGLGRGFHVLEIELAFTRGAGVIEALLDALRGGGERLERPARRGSGRAGA